MIRLLVCLCLVAGTLASLSCSTGTLNNEVGVGGASGTCGAGAANCGGSAGGRGGAGGGGAGTLGGCGHMCNHAPANHRVTGETCTVDRTGGAGGAGGASGSTEVCGGSDGSGGRGAPCTGGLNAACCFSGPTDFYGSCRADSCATDSDCGPMHICVCVAGTGACNRNFCQQAACRTDADCGAGGYCSLSRNYPTLSDSTYVCHTPDDECIDDSDCNGGQSGCPAPHCGFDGFVMHWRCTSMQVPGCL